MNRRDFLKFVGVASSASVLSSCGVEKSTEKIIPLLYPAEEGYIPGEAMYKSATCSECPAGCGVSVKVVEFNPVKLEGLKNHPVNDGALCLRGQASLMRLYHPRRVRGPLRPKKGGLVLDKMSGDMLEPVTWEVAYQSITDALKAARDAGKSNVYLSGRTSGSLSALIDSFSREPGVERLPEYEAFSHANLRAAYRAVLGVSSLPSYKVANADFLLTVGADILETFMNPVSMGQQLQRARETNNLTWIHFEPHVSLTGFKASERKILPPGSEAYLLSFLLNYFVGNQLAQNNLPANVRESLPDAPIEEVVRQTGMSEDELNQLAQRMGAARNPLLIVGGVSTQQKNGYETALLGALVQWVTGMTGSTVDFSRAEDYSKVGNVNDLTAFAQRLENEQIGVAFVTRTDTLFRTVPAQTRLSENFAKAAFKVAFVDILDQNDKELVKSYSEMYDLILPLSHSLESWGDAEVQNGLVNITQPVIAQTIFDTRSEGDILLELSRLYRGAESAVAYADWLKTRWTNTYGEAALTAALQTGYYQRPAGAVSLSLNSSGLVNALKNTELDSSSDGKVLYVVPSIRMYDGRSKDLPLTNEVPDPLSTISYGQWISVSEAAAGELGLDHNNLIHKQREVVRLESGGGAMELPAWVQPGMPDNIATIHREQVDPALLDVDPRTGETLTRIDGLSLSKTGANAVLAIMAGKVAQGDRKIIPSGHDDHGHHGHIKGDETLYPDPYDRYTEYRWGMSIDMETCIGCSACVSACYIENNIPCVGEEENVRGREMAWIRVQPYYNEEGGMDSLIMLCQQCDFAPCENVCPVYATYHNEEGLNVMVYNRCVGTRYCHNNCPYKVRRFNWFDWTDRGAWEEPMTRMLNPDIWVRPKGVMEKCTFCIQRIRKAKDVAKDEKRKVRDGEVIPACAQTCPTNAITFGNLLDQESQVFKKSQSEREFRVLEALGTSPAIHYLRKEEHA